MRPSAWRTMNWLRLGGDVFMVQQRWELYKQEVGNGRHHEYGSISQEAFPTDEWRVVSLTEMLPQEDLNKLLEAKEEELQ